MSLLGLKTNMVISLKETLILFSILKKDNADGFDYFAHMWVGMETSVDEAGTGAYKIVELDDSLKGAATLVYEPQDSESTVFMSYFKSITIMEGGIESGFQKVPIEQYKPRLFHVRGVGKLIHSSEVPLAFRSLNLEDVFILDAGLKLFNWRGKKASSYEKFHGAWLCEKIKGERSGKTSIIHLDQGDKNDEFLILVLFQRRNK